MKAIAYLRVSSEEQDLERQYQDIKRFAKSKDLELIKIFTEKISATRKSVEERIGFNDAQRYLKSNSNIRNLLVLEVSRLGRRNVDILNIIERLYEMKINVHIIWGVC